MDVVANMTVRFRVKRFKIKAALGSRSIGGILNFGDRCSSIWYRGSRGEQENMRLIWGASMARPWCVRRFSTYGIHEDKEVHTLALCIPPVDARAGHQDIVDNGEAALAADPAAVPGQDAGIVEHRGLVQAHAPTVDGACKRHLFRVEIVKA
jgi:hypothetical protein